MIEFVPIDGIGEIAPGTDLAAVIAAGASLADGDVVVVTSKVVSKSLGLATTRPKDDVVEEGTARVVARRGPTRIVRTHHGLTLAAAGVDASNVAADTVLPLPPDPDGFAREVRRRLQETTGRLVGVVVSDTAGRAWRVGQTDIAIGCAGLLPFDSFAGQVDAHGNPLVVTAPAVADEVAAAAELASGKLGGRPIVVVRGLDPRLLTVDDGPGAAALVRGELEDLFGWGARDAVVAAVAGDVRGFPASDLTLDEVVAAVDPGPTTVTVTESLVEVTAEPTDAVTAGAVSERIRLLLVAHRLDATVRVTLEL